ncbi:receptor expression-enhancing protein 1 isoform X3 [Pleurodeles waltl]
MMYWIIFALFTTVETFTDLFLCWFPFYYELKIAFVAWLLSPYTKGSSLLYRKFVHPTLSSKEKEIDDCLVQAKDRSYDALVHFGKRGLNVAATAAVTAAAKGQGALSERLRSFSMQDLSTIGGDGPAPTPVTVRTNSKQSKPKTVRSAPQGTDSPVCLCCSVCKVQQVAEVYGAELEESRAAEGDVQVLVVSGGTTGEGIQQAEQASKANPPVKTRPPLEAPPRTLRPRFRTQGTATSKSEPM